MKENLFNTRLGFRKGKENVASVVFLLSTVFAILSLTVLISGIIDKSFGFVALEDLESYVNLQVDSKELNASSDAELIVVLTENLRPRILTSYIESKPLEKRSRSELEEILTRELLEPQVVKTYSLSESLFSKDKIIAELKEIAPDAYLSFRAWLSPSFLMGSQSSDALWSGIRGALIGSFMTILITILIAFPIGTGAAIYLEEYAKDNAFNRFIQTNIYNLSGVPSIIYGMLGLAIFVRGMGPITSGLIFGIGNAESASGRTILSASLTLSILILPVIIINAQEALKAVPRSLRHSSLALGATKWQTIWNHVLPASMDRILTGTVLGISRAIGETAPLVVVGAASFLSQDPSGPFSKFTTLPIQIYQWTSYPKEEFKNIAAAAILVLIILLITLNSVAIMARNKYRKEKR